MRARQNKRERMKTNQNTWEQTQTHQNATKSCRSIFMWLSNRPKSPLVLHIIKSDQYSLAIVFQEMLTGERPFSGGTAAQLANQHLHSHTTIGESSNISALPETIFSNNLQFNSTTDS